MKDPYLRIQDVKQFYKVHGQTTWALDGISLDVYMNEFISITGPAGSGKSCLLNILYGLEMPAEGHVLVQGSNMSTMDSEQLAYLRSKQISYVMQNPSLIQSINCMDNIKLSLVLHGMLEKEAEYRAMDVLKQLRMDSLCKHMPQELSASERQLIAIGRALSVNPDILLADNILNILDKKQADLVLKLIFKMLQAMDMAIISTSNHHALLTNSDRIIHLEQGKIVKTSSRKEREIQFESA